MYSHEKSILYPLFYFYKTLITSRGLCFNSQLKCYNLNVKIYYMKGLFHEKNKKIWAFLRDLLFMRLSLNQVVNAEDK